jgi:hypothetical protein
LSGAPHPRFGLFVFVTKTAPCLSTVVLCVVDECVRESRSERNGTFQRELAWEKELETASYTRPIGRFDPTDGIVNRHVEKVLSPAATGYG